MFIIDLNDHGYTCVDGRHLKPLDFTGWTISDPEDEAGFGLVISLMMENGLPVNHRLQPLPGPLRINIRYVSEGDSLLHKEVWSTRVREGR